MASVPGDSATVNATFSDSRFPWSRFELRIDVQAGYTAGAVLRLMAIGLV